jgi:uncharacterized protein YjbJ (UPF0337 family)
MGILRQYGCGLQGLGTSHDQIIWEHHSRYAATNTLNHADFTCWRSLHGEALVVLEGDVPLDLLGDGYLIPRFPKPNTATAFDALAGGLSLPIQFLALSLLGFSPLGKPIALAGDHQQIDARARIMRGLGHFAPFARSRRGTNSRGVRSHRINGQLEERVMNWDRIAGNWKQFTGKAKEKWGKLTDDDWTVIAGKRDQFVGKVQERYGISKDEAEKRVAEYERSYEKT